MQIWKIQKYWKRMSIRELLLKNNLSQENQSFIFQIPGELSI